MKRAMILLPILAACGSSDDDPASDLATDEPGYIEACAATEVEGPAPTTEVEWTYALAGDRFTETAADGEVWTWDFSAARLMTSLVFDDNGADSYSEQREYDAADNLIAAVVDIDGAAGEEPTSTTRHSYDGDLLVESTNDAESDQVIDSRTAYTNDQRGNEVLREIDLGDDGSVDQIEERSYDGDRLLSIERDTDNDGAIDERSDFSYDAAGDLVGVEVVDAGGERLRTVTITRDARGNQIERVDERPTTGLTIEIRASFDDRDRMLTSGFSFTFDGTLAATSDFAYRYDCP